MPRLTRRHLIGTLAAASSTAAAGGLLYVRNRAQHLNFIFILADDLGWADAGCYGSTFHETPHIDALAARGMRFTQAYAASPLCTANRAAILTGKHPARLNITAASGHRPYDKRIRDEQGRRIGYQFEKLRVPSWTEQLPAEEVTIAEILKGYGYATGHIGKWHLGSTGHFPTDQGFDVNWGGGPSGGPGSHFAPYGTNLAPTRFFPHWEPGMEREYLTDCLNRHARQYVEDHRKRPFFMTWWDYGVHVPLQAPPELIEYHKARVDPNSRQRNPIYAAMITKLDDAIGRLMAKLDELGLAERTVVFLSSDNGGLLRDTLSGQRVTSNAPLRDGKGCLYEGGIRVPLIVCGPGVVPNSVCDVPVSSVDFLPTMLEMAGIPPPEDHVMDGVSIASLLRGAKRLSREYLFWHFPHYDLDYCPTIATIRYRGRPAAAVRRAEWKLLRFFEGYNELYNLDTDLGEQHNLVDERPEVAAPLSAELIHWLEEVKAQLPRPNPIYAPPDAFDGWIALAGGYMTRGADCLKIHCLTAGTTIAAPADIPAGEISITLCGRTTSKGTIGAALNRHRWPVGGDRPDMHAAGWLIPDGEWHECTIKRAPEQDADCLRIMPCFEPGILEIAWIQVKDSEGQTIAEWDFGKAEPEPPPA